MGYIGTEPVPKVSKVRTTGQLLSATTTIPVPGGFTPGNIEVYVNGYAVQPADYNDSDGSNLVFTEALDAGSDYIVIEARAFETSNTPTLAGGSQANFSAMPQVGGDPIVESGSNTDGEWTRWADGTQQCSANVQYDYQVFGAANPTNYIFPQAFIATYGAGYSLTSTSSGSLLNDQSSMVLSVTNSDWKLRMGQRTSSFGVLVSNLLFVTGHWK